MSFYLNSGSKLLEQNHIKWFIDDDRLQGNSSKCFNYIKDWASKEGKKTSTECKKTLWFWLKTSGVEHGFIIP